MIGWADWIKPIEFIGGAGGDPIDPAFLVTNGGETVTHNGAAVTYGSDIDPALLVTNDGAVVTADAAIVTYGA
ncbi:MAG TPA: hypothetical protein GX700_16715 [Paracoccus sp.]|nr:hypothetical protein [Paracoccus sp. (in: a-proteobacteria)]